jgi:hypothetical protein
VTDDARQRHLAFLVSEAEQGRLAGVPPLPQQAAGLFGEAGWLRRLIRARGADPGLAALAGYFAEAELAWHRELGELLDKLTGIEAITAGLDDGDPAAEDRKRELRAEVSRVAASVRAASQRDARGLLAGIGLLPPQPAPPRGAAAAAGDCGPAPAELMARLVNLLGYWAWPSGGVVTRDAISLRRADGPVTRWRCSRAGAEPALVLRREEGEPMEVAVFLDAYEQRAAPAGNRIAADAALRRRLRAAGTVVFQLTTDEVAALVGGGDAPHAPPYEADAQAAARRGYQALGGDPAALDGMIWRGSARTLLAFLTSPDRDHWRRVATAALAGLHVRPGGWRTGLTQGNATERILASVLGDPLPASAGRERTLLRVLDAAGCPVTVISDQRDAGPDAPLGAWTGLAVLDDRLAAIRGSEPAHRRRWASWLRWGNLLQFADGQQLAYTALAELDPAALAAASDAPPAPGELLIEVISVPATPASPASLGLPASRDPGAVRASGASPQDPPAAQAR